MKNWYRWVWRTDTGEWRTDTDEWYRWVIPVNDTEWWFSSVHDSIECSFLFLFEFMKAFVKLDDNIAAHSEFVMEQDFIWVDVSTTRACEYGFSIEFECIREYAVKRSDKLSFSIFFDTEASNDLCSNDTRAEYGVMSVLAECFVNTGFVLCCKEKGYVSMASLESNTLNRCIDLLCTSCNTVIEDEKDAWIEVGVLDNSNESSILGSCKNMFTVANNSGTINVSDCSSILDR